MKNINSLTGGRNSPESDEPPIFAMVTIDFRTPWNHNLDAKFQERFLSYVDELQNF
jgi:hypothetical protein